MSYSAHQRKTEYENEFAAMSKQEQAQQTRFEQIINLLVLYKQSNIGTDVFLSEKEVKKAIQWSQKEVIDKLKE